MHRQVDSDREGQPFTACAQARGITVVKVLRLAPPHLAPQGAWKDVSVSLQTVALHASFAAVCMPRSCLDRPSVRPGGHMHSSSLPIMGSCLGAAGCAPPGAAVSTVCTCGVQVYDRASLAGMLATKLSAECVASGVEALRQCGRPTGSGNLLAGLPRDHTGYVRAVQTPLQPAHGPGSMRSRHRLVRRAADHSVLLHFEGLGSSGSCALLMTSRGSCDLVRLRRAGHLHTRVLHSRACH